MNVLGFVNALLSWKAFVPLGKLTYVAYLFHWSFVKVHVYQSRKPFYYHGLDETLHYLAVLTLTFMASFVICLLIEIPFLNLEKAIFNFPQNGKNILIGNFSVLTKLYLNISCNKIPVDSFFAP